MDQKYGKIRENTHSGHSRVTSTGTIEVLPVELRLWSFLAKFYR